MKEIKLTQGKVALVDDEDYEWLNQWKWCASYCVDTDSYYAVRNSGEQKILLMHRIILGITDSKMRADHIDHNTLNNKRSNLRAATRSQNSSNRKSARKSSSKYLGVCWYKPYKKWTSEIQKADKRCHLGYFESEIDAALAYNKKALELHGEFANLNVI